MRHFPIAGGLGPDGWVTFIRRPHKHGRFVLQAPMDYPPDWMLTETHDHAKQELDPGHFDALATYRVAYPRAFAREGTTIDSPRHFDRTSVTAPPGVTVSGTG